MNNHTRSADLNQITCPHCGDVFTIDEAQYAHIAQQVRTAEFDNELHDRLAAAEKAKQAEIALAIAQANQTAQQTTATKDSEIQRLKAEIKAAATEQELAITQAVSATDQKLRDAQAKLALQAAEQKAKDAALRETHRKELAMKDDLIERYKDLKAKLSVKLLGETLEQHCEIEFERVRPLAFPHAQFGKDSDASRGTKGDYVLPPLLPGRSLSTRPTSPSRSLPAHCSANSAAKPGEHS